MLDAAYSKTRIDMTDGEKRQFFEKYIKTLKLTIGLDGEAHIAVSWRT